MPEGNEIHRWAERHTAAFAGKAVRVDGPQGRFIDAAVIDGRKLQRVMAVGKHLGYDFGRDRILHVHLGLQGDFTEGSGPLPEVRGALRLRMWNEAAVKKPAVAGESKPHRGYSEDDGTDNLAPEKVAWVELRGPMDCSVYSQEMGEKLLARLGHDAPHRLPVAVGLAAAFLVAAGQAVPRRLRPDHGRRAARARLAPGAGRRCRAGRALHGRRVRERLRSR